jgi:hypothetical protein
METGNTLDAQPGEDGGTGAPGDTVEILVFDNFDSFSETVAAMGNSVNFAALRSLRSNFIQPAEEYLILSLKHFESEQADNLLFLSEERIILYSASPPTSSQLDDLSLLFGKPFGKSTALTFSVLRSTTVNYQARLDSLIVRMEGLEREHDAKMYRELSLDFSRLYDRLEDFYEILLRLEESGIKQVETRYIAFDYRVLMAEADNLVNRCRNRFSIFKEFARDHELQVTTELNLRMERLNDVVKRLTAITLILMIPTLIASHFGMNFVYMPELRVAWAYPAVVVSQVVLIVVAAILFKKAQWL